MVRQTTHVARVGNVRNANEILVGDFKGRNLVVDERMILK